MFVRNSGQIGLKANRQKCKVLRLNTKNKDTIKIDEESIEDVNRFEYLGAVISDAGGGTMDLQNRLGKARTAFNRLKSVWSSNNISRNTKLKLYKTSKTCIDVRF